VAAEVLYEITQPRSFRSNDTVVVQRKVSSDVPFILPISSSGPSTAIRTILLFMGYPDSTLDQSGPCARWGEGESSRSRVEGSASGPTTTSPIVRAENCARGRELVGIQARAVAITVNWRYSRGRAAPIDGRTPIAKVVGISGQCSQRLRAIRADLPRRARAMIDDQPMRGRRPGSAAATKRKLMRPASPARDFEHRSGD